MNNDIQDIVQQALTKQMELDDIVVKTLLQKQGIATDCSKEFLRQQLDERGLDIAFCMFPDRRRVARIIKIVDEMEAPEVKVEFDPRELPPIAPPDQKGGGLV